IGRLPHDALVTRDDVPRTKPDPIHLVSAMESLGLHPTNDSQYPAVMIGDHFMDVRAGIDAGMRTVGLLLGRPTESYDPAPPDLIVDELRELLPLVNGLHSD